LLILPCIKIIIRMLTDNSVIIMLGILSETRRNDQQQQQQEEDSFIRGKKGECSSVIMVEKMTTRKDEIMKLVMINQR